MIHEIILYAFIDIIKFFKKENVMAKIKVAVIFGGVSREHKLSLASAYEVITNIPKEKYIVTCIGITKKGHWLYYPGDPADILTGEWELNQDCASAVISPDPLHRGIIILENGEASVRKIDVIFPLLQGKFGADGTIQGLLDMSGIPYVGSGILSAGSCMDKSHTHMILDDYGINTANWTLLTQRDINSIDSKCEEISSKLEFPIKVRPANSGSSTGSGVAENIEQLVSAVKVAFSNDNKVVAEEYVKGKKLEVGVFGYDNLFTSEVGEILSVDKVYDPTEVKTTDSDDLQIPADIPNELRKSIRETALQAYQALGCKGFARIEFFLAQDGTFVLNKINTSPGMRKNSVYPRLMENIGMSMSYLVDKMLEQAIENSEN